MQLAHLAQLHGGVRHTAATDPRGGQRKAGGQGKGAGRSPHLLARSETALARGSSTKDATTLALCLRASSSRPCGVFGSAKPGMLFSGKILTEYSPVA